MEKLIRLAIVVVLVSGMTYSGYYLGHRDGYTEGYANGTTDTQDSTNAKKGALLYKLRVCINDSGTKDAQTDCFRKAYNDQLPEPTLTDYNKLPDIFLSD